MATKKTAASKPAKSPATTSAPSKAAAKTPAKKTATKSSETRSPATREQIADLAHKYFQERGGHHGSHVADWLRAEQELNG